MYVRHDNGREKEDEGKPERKGGTRERRVWFVAGGFDWQGTPGHARKERNGILGDMPRAQVTFLYKSANVDNREMCSMIDTATRTNFRLNV